ncbi:nucleotide sugar dehydrogenase [Halomonas elongata]|uniref:nucleotide sugar dehydrogenase n=1 Tax=Halomonas elongata TaxID=2746 RepID=UPI00334ACDA9
MNLDNVKIAVIGLGYVGLPLAVEFGKKYRTIGFDIKESRVQELNDGVDSTRELSSDELSLSNNIVFSSIESDIVESNVYIVTVPTPIDDHRQPDLTPLIKASELLGRVLSKGDVVIYESTVYPGATEEDCIPVVEKVSGLELNKDFFAGYSPERINPGDKEHPVSKIMKVTSGSTPQAADFVDNLYKSIIVAGTFKAASIKVAEASKIIENTQRDVNIALVNELSIIFSHIGIDTKDVIDASSTKWNFIKYTPGLVGGHCIGVDPYYLVHKSMASGYIPDIIRKSREINDGMAKFSASKLVKSLIKKGKAIKGAKVLLMGMAFKENCPDIRNTKVVDLLSELEEYEMDVEVYDPWVSFEDASCEYGITLLDSPAVNSYEVIILAVGHREFLCGEIDVSEYGVEDHMIFDLKGVLGKKENVLRL